MNDTKKTAPLSIEETMRLLGADVAIPIGEIEFNPLTANELVARIRRRLVSTGGRPTDPAWNISRKVPMRQSVWDLLTNLANDFEREGRRVSPGQIAAIALEQGIPRLFHKEGSLSIGADEPTPQHEFQFTRNAK